MRFKKLKIKTDGNIDMIRLYDDVKKIFNPLTSPSSSEKLEIEESNTKDMPEESAAQRREQEGQGLKILTQEQMLS